MTSVRLLCALAICIFPSWLLVPGHVLATNPIQKRAKLTMADLSLDGIINPQINPSLINWKSANIKINEDESMVVENGIQPAAGYEYTTFGWDNPHACLVVIFMFPRLATMAIMPRERLEEILGEDRRVRRQAEKYTNNWAVQVFNVLNRAPSAFTRAIRDHLAEIHEPPKAVILTPKTLWDKYPGRMEELVGWIKYDAEGDLKDAASNLKVERWEIVKFAPPPPDNDDDQEGIDSTNDDDCAEEEEGYQTDDTEATDATDATEAWDSDEEEQWDQEDHLANSRRERGGVGLAWLCTDPATKKWEWAIFTQMKGGMEPTLSGIVAMDLDPGVDDADDADDAGHAGHAGDPNDPYDSDNTDGLDDLDDSDGLYDTDDEDHAADSDSDT